MKLFIAAALTAASVAVATSASATESARLVYARSDAADSCGDEMDFQRAIAARLGNTPFFSGAKRSLVVHLDADGDDLRGRLELVQDGKVVGARELRARGPACDDLFSALALAAAIALDPQRALAVPSSPAPAAPAPSEPPVTPVPLPPPPVEPPAPERKPPPPPPPAARAALELGLGGGLSVGTAPAPTIGVFASAAAAWPRVSLAVEGRLDVDATTPGPRRGNARSSLALGSFVPCLRAGAFAACGLLSIGRFGAEGVGVSDPRSDDALYVAAGARLGARLELATDIFLDVRVEATAPSSRPRLILDRAEVWRMPAVNGNAGAFVVKKF